MCLILSSSCSLEVVSLSAKTLVRQCPQDLVKCHECNQLCQINISSLRKQLRFLNTKLVGHFAEKNLFFQASYVTNVRDWSGSLLNFATTYGAYRKRYKDTKDIPHSYTFVRRECPLVFLWNTWRRVKSDWSNPKTCHWGMPQQLVDKASNDLPRRYNESTADVFLLIKGFVSDHELCQEPLLVWPGEKASETFDKLCDISMNNVNCNLPSAKNHNSNSKF